MKFEWDQAKARINEQKHKISFLESCFIFSDKNILTKYNKEHSSHEDRWISIGSAPNGKIIVVVHTFKTINEKDVVRIISARKATKKEIKHYYQRKDKS